MRMPPRGPEGRKPEDPRQDEPRDHRKAPAGAGGVLPGPEEAVVQHSRRDQEEEQEELREPQEGPLGEEPVRPRKDRGEETAGKVARPDGALHLFGAAHLRIDASGFLAGPRARDAIARRISVAAAELAVRAPALH